MSNSFAVPIEKPELLDRCVIVDKVHSLVKKSIREGLVVVYTHFCTLQCWTFGEEVILKRGMEWIMKTIFCCFSF